MHLLAIETSCDETAAAVLKLEDDQLTVLSSVVSSQVALHAQYGGVVPNLAAREHVRNIVPVVEEALDQSKLTPGDIDAIAVTQGPGLIPALLVGVSAAKTLALAWEKPLLGINHLEGHIYANFISSPNNELRITNYELISKNRNLQIQSTFKIQNSKFPLLALIVSGGHTQLILMRDHFQYELLGETEDDAAGEAFDKVAKMLGLPYPGGPAVAQKADTFRERNFQANSNDSIAKVKTGLFPRPMMDADNFAFSFSGLKTAVLYFLKEHQTELQDENFVATVCHEFQEAVVDVLVGKTKRAIETFQPRTVIIAGGVSANKRLRERMQQAVEGYQDTAFTMPLFEYSLDNAAMIGAAGLLRYARLNENERQVLRDNVTSLEPSAHFPLATNA